MTKTDAGMQAGKLSRPPVAVDSTEASVCGLSRCVVCSNRSHARRSVCCRAERTLTGLMSFKQKTSVAMTTRTLKL